ncbi:FAD:protein FMN transferase [Undibacterium sp.]|jgi:thiamine biosynthesis lipoprotein|uniref:FAD:protein FMN transferase n=1 Tax=Undibacterium sp. TaxID=1914977 RepID=UPI002CC7B4B3|nr:FAD:protein FMN transferase [Undibacterium sp.]HTD04303.1 FAD:protein FMN transferase [Undibacterium sp.]
MNRVLIPLTMAPPPSISTLARIDSLAGANMGTNWSVKLVCPEHLSLPKIHAGIQRQLDQVVAQMSTWLETSDLSRFNRAAAGSWHPLPKEFFQVLDYALYVAQQSNGAYDPTVGPLVNLWGFGPDRTPGGTPAPAAISAALARQGRHKLRLDRVQQRAWQPGGVYIDLSSIAKGFGVDQVANYLQTMGVPSYLVEVGGELRGYGSKPDNDPWWVALERPLPATPAGDGLAPQASIVALHELSVATSGDYRRFFEQDGQRYSHTIDPRNGYPVRHTLASVTVLHSSCMIADALATAFTVLGAEEGMDYARRENVAAHFASRTTQGFDERMSPAFEAMLE